MNIIIFINNNVSVPKGSHMAAPSSCPTVSKIGASLYNASPRTRTVQSKPNIPSTFNNGLTKATLVSM